MHVKNRDEDKDENIKIKVKMNGRKAMGR